MNFLVIQGGNTIEENLMYARLLISVMLVSTLFGCFREAQETEIPADQVVADCNKVQISSTTAILIAKGYLFQDYKVSDYQLEVVEDLGNWKIQLTLKCEDCNGGNPYVLIDKRNGDVIKVFHSK